MFVRFLTQLLRYGCVLVLAAAVLAGCAIDPAVRNSRDPAAISVTTAPSAANVTVGASQNFTAVVTADSKSRGVTWSLSGAGCSGATCGTLTNVSGIGATYTAPASVPSPAVVTLTAASAADPAKSSSSIVTIVAQTTVSVSPSSASVSPGMTQNFTAAVTGDPANKGVVWTLSGSGCSGATCGTLANVTTTAVAYTAPASVPSPATVMLTASSLADASEISSAKITIVPPAIAVTLSPSTANITTGQNQNFTATVSNDPANKGVTWSLSGSGCSGASCGTLTNQTTTSVTYTAPASAPSPATVTLTATSV
ncbi:MAG TPA: hypothetical protein VFW94_20780, partial [Candidatus Acidoferrales bacterium]|nr:hypothetical protein [Candidatus Acidoferrales bacterium]